MNGSRKRSTSYDTIILIHHGGAALVALSGARGEESATGDRRVPRIDSRIRQCEVKAGRERAQLRTSSVEHENCWTVIA